MSKLPYEDPSWHNDVVNEILEKLFTAYKESLINNYECDLDTLKGYYE